MMNRRGGVGFLVFILLLVLLVVVVFVIIFLKGVDEPEVVSVNVTGVLFNVSILSDADGRVDYVLRNESGVLLRGGLFPDVLEFYRGGVLNGSLVWLSASSDNFYWNEVVCNVSFENFPCNVSLKRKALGYSVVFNGSELVVDTNEVGAVLQNPIICISEKANVQNVILNLDTVPVPSDLKKSYDFCYKVGQDIIGRRVFSVDVHKNEFYNVSDVLVVLVRDYEKSSFQNIGDRQTGIIV
jgi:hypothetical protein